MYKLFRKILSAISLCLACCLSMSAFAAVPTADEDGNVQAYTNIPTYSVNEDITLRVGGVDIPVQNNADGIPFARFAMSGQADVEVTLKNGITSVRIRPIALDIPYEVSGGTLRFTLDKPLKFKIDFNTYDDNGSNDAYLFLFADPPETDAPDLRDDTVKNILDFDGVSNQGRLCTEAIQEAIDWVSENADKTNILYFPKGVYYTGSLVIKDNVQLYLSSGALILGSDNYDDYKEVYDFPPDQPHERAFLIMQGAKNVKIFGRGTVDSNGRQFGAGGGAYGGSKVITLYSGVDENREGSSNLVINDIMLTNGWFYQYFLCGATDTSLTNIKAFNTCANGNETLNVDAFKIMCGHNITLKDAFLMGNDDVITTGADGPQADGELYDCTIEDVILYQTSVASLVRIAFTNRFAVHDIVIRNVLSIDNWAGTVIKAENFPGYNYCNPIYNMTFENFIVEGAHNLLSWGIDNNDDTFSYFDNWKFKNISIWGGSLPTTLKGTSNNKKVTNFSFEDVMINGGYCRSAADANLTVDPASTENITFTVTHPLLPVSEGLIAYLNLDGNVADTSNLINPDGNYAYYNAAYGQAAPSDGKFGQAYSFQGNDYISLDKAAVVRSSVFSTAFWIKTTDVSTGTGDNLWEKPQITGVSTPGASSSDFNINLDGGYLTYCSGLDTSGDLQFRTDRFVADDNWHLVAATCDGTASRIYLDGELLSGTINGEGNYDAVPASGLGLTGDVSWQIGNAQGIGYTGLVDDFAFWGRVLTEEEIEIIYNGGEGRTVEDAAKLLNVKEEQTGFAFAGGDATLPYSPGFSFVNTAAGGQSSGEISYAITSGTGVASIDPITGEITGVTKPGILVVTATKAGDENYYAAKASYTLTVTKGEQTGFSFMKEDTSMPYAEDFRYINKAIGGQTNGAVVYAITGGTGTAVIDPASGEITEVVKAGTIQVTATKTGSDLYNDAMATYTLTVEKALPEILTAPAAGQVEAGACLSDALLTGGQASVPGSFVWSDPDSIVSASGAYAVHFVPEDTDNYETVTDIQVQVTVAGEEPIQKGDLDEDGKVTIADVMEACKVLARKSGGDKPSADEIARGDLNGDGDISIEDIMAICKILARQS